ncbi:MAG: cytidine deaminase [Muribaculaceae bacterium]|nr:cytidine deaminase [Muribaculaceae bacterium]
MKERKIVALIDEYRPEELPQRYTDLVDAAKAATTRAHAPYSRFHVGAAIRMENGEIVCGANQENAAFSAGTCAERSACFYAASQYPGVAMKQIAIAAYLEPEGYPQGGGLPFQKQPISPCGVCRQALLEYEAMYGDIEVILYGNDVIYVLPSIKSLMPLSFTEF